MAQKVSLSITKTGCHIGPSINSRTEKHGDDSVPSADIPLSGIMLDRSDLCELLDDKYAYNALFNSKGKLVEPLFPQLSYSVRNKYEKCSATLYLDGANEFTLGDAKFKNVHLEPQTGGLTELSLTVQCHPTDVEMGALFMNQDHMASVSLRFGKVSVKEKPQPELPLDHLGPNEVPGPMDVTQ